MANKVKTWLSAIRPRTLPLSLAGTIMGGCIALPSGEANLWAWLLSGTTAALLQILSNLANDYGDFAKGTDNAMRKGPQRAMQTGSVSATDMKRAIGIVAASALLSGAALVFVVARLSISEMLAFAALGTGAVAAALLYTLGRHPYGYRGLGDLYCFIFFGIVSVAGTFFLVSHRWDYTILLPAAAIGLMSNAVLNINNMRDIDNDKNSGKNSLVVKIGLRNAYRYHVALIAVAFVCLATHVAINGKSTYCYLFALMLPLFVKDLVEIRTTPPQSLDPFLKRQSIKTFALAIVYGTLWALS